MGKLKGRIRTSLFTKNLFVTILIILFSFGILGSFLLVFVSQYWAEQKSAVLSETTRSFASSTAELLSTGRIDMKTEGSIVTLCSSLSLISNAIDADVFVTDIYGDVLLCRHLVSKGVVIENGYCAEHAELTIPAAAMAQACEGSFNHVGNLDGTLGESCFVVAKPVIVKGNTRCVVFAMVPTVTGLLPYVFSIFEKFFIASIFALLIAFFAVYLLTYSFTKPLRQMAKATKAYSKGDFSYRIAVHRRDELGTLAENFNSMAHELALLESSRRSFVANVSHELKTPMTTIAGFVDGILDGTIPEERYSHYLGVVSDEVKRLSRLVSSMLNLSKIDAGQLELKFVDIDISSIILPTVLSFEQKIVESKINIEGLDTMQPVSARADRDMISQVVYNLIDNAVKFTPPGGTITVSAAPVNGRAVVKIRNTGAGVASEEISRIFERFYKVDKSRSFDTKSTGLGLYIVKSILELHDGNISACSVEGEYTEFTFDLPQ